MARPKSPSPRIFSVTASLTAEEMVYVAKKIEAAGMSRSEATRLLLLREVLPAQVRIGLRAGASDLFTKLAPTQSNLNQIAAHLNKNPGAAISKEIYEVIAKNVITTYCLVKQFREEVIGARATEGTQP